MLAAQLTREQIGKLPVGAVFTPSSILEAIRSEGIDCRIESVAVARICFRLAAQGYLAAEPRLHKIDQGTYRKIAKFDEKRVTIEWEEGDPMNWTRTVTVNGEVKQIDQNW